jgi:glycosyltransferase involved in cell wall biosynthesis
MNVLVLCHEAPPVGGGAGAVAVDLAAELGRLGHEITTLTMSWGDLPREERTEAGSLIRLPAGRKGREEASIGEALRWARRAVKTATAAHRQAGFDVVHAHFVAPAGLAAARLRQRLELPFLITVHGSDVPGYSAERFRLVHRLIRPLWRRVVRAAGTVVSPSDSLRRLMLAAGAGRRIEVIPNGFDPNRLQPERKGRHLLLCGRLIERKGFHIFLDSLRGCSLDGWNIDVIGDGPLRSRLEQIALSGTLPVTFHGWLDRQTERWSQIFGRASILVVPSISENFPIVLIEGMSAGCAILATDVGGNREVLGDAGIVVPLHDPSSSRAQLARLLDDDDLRHNLGQRARRRLCERFSWSVVAARYETVLENVRASS